MKKMSKSPTQLALKYYREQGYLCWITEYWHAHGKVRKDLLGFIDMIALNSYETIGVQCTSKAGGYARKKKILTDEDVSPRAKLWLQAGNHIHLTTFSKNDKTNRYEKKIEPITLGDFKNGTKRG